MATFFKTSRLWIVDYTWRGRPRRAYKALPDGVDGTARLAAELAEVQGRHARLVQVRPATADEESEYLRGLTPPNVMCPTGRR
ncbi:hypothetical protein [Ramlibacter rhizophilus]|uniref:Uncharacterized protein n=1 Tax=Ramlibacter rhizophilus TaxID=1781167 RepID=A0A4Z0C3B0_9BURK|nr:hypothetical protein [Ramlibacter rhizophilus]TFZ04960.1 hypothetical protein EZ242_04215 [Ramlibacter rhizophilus]